MNLKDEVKGGKTVHLVRYRKGNLYYRTDGNFEFAVPVADCGDATFSRIERAINLMRWLRPAIKDFNEGKLLDG